MGKTSWRSAKLRARKLLSAGLILVGLWFCLPAASVWSFSPDEDLTARSALLIDANTGNVLYQKEPDLRLPPASTTKVLTAILTLESGRSIRQSLTVSKGATRVPASKLYLRPGQTLTIEDLLYGILLSSANDASMVLAEGISGSVKGFAELMTKKAHEIGAVNSHFANPHGLTAPDHYSTARDLTTLFRYAMRNATFREIVQTKISSVSSSSIVRRKRVARRISVRNHNRLLWNFDGAMGGKTGYTFAAQKCFVGAVQRNGLTVIVSIMGSRDLWGDTKRLLEYGFDRYDTLKAGMEPAETVAAASELTGMQTDRVSARLVAPDGDREAKVADGYVLQLGAFRERERAETLLRQVTEKGFEGFIEKFLSLYRVRLGPFSELAHAQNTADQIHDSVGYRVFIVPTAAAAAGPG
jgi:D-alanyl-D-alanine carboxypeptidase (penicillin-binding protein 5/6)